jgi:Ca-activated chloride channel homolog
MNPPTLSIVPLRPALPDSADNTSYALIRVSAPEAPEQATRRAPLHVALVIDRSGSMSGRPLEEAKRCAAFVIAGLRDSDRTSLVVYDNQVDVLVPALPVAEGTELRRAIETIHSGGQTNLHGGWFKGAQTLAPHARDNVLSRVIILSDGCANQGITDEAVIAKQCAELAQSGVTTSTYGLGQHFNESLMQAIARAGRGNAYYGATADDLMDPFREELALLNALMARRLELHLEPRAGVHIEVLNSYPSVGFNTWRLPDLPYGAEAWALVRIRVSNAVLDQGSHCAVSLLQATVAAIDLDGIPLLIEPANLALSTVDTAAYAMLAEHELVRRRLQEVEAAHSADAARIAAGRGDWEAVDQLLAALRKKVHDSPWLQAIVRELETLAAQRDDLAFGKETRYSALRLGSRLAACRESPSPDAVDVPDYVRRKSAQGKAAPPKLFRKK